MSVRTFDVFQGDKWIGKVSALSLRAAEKAADKKFSGWDRLEECCL